MLVSMCARDGLLVSPVQLDLSINPEDPNGWAYAAAFSLCGGVAGLDNQGSFDSIRRRRWTRTMVRVPPLMLTGASGEPLPEGQRAAHAAQLNANPAIAKQTHNGGHGAGSETNAASEAVCLSMIADVDEVPSHIVPQTAVQVVPAETGVVSRLNMRKDVQTVDGATGQIRIENAGRAGAAVPVLKPKKSRRRGVWLPTGKKKKGGEKKKKSVAERNVRSSRRQ